MTAPGLFLAPHEHPDGGGPQQATQYYQKNGHIHLQRLKLFLFRTRQIKNGCRVYLYAGYSGISSAAFSGIFSRPLLRSFGGTVSVPGSSRGSGRLWPDAS